MTPDGLLNAERVGALVDELCTLPAETPWVEWKENNSDPAMIGRLISALANAARLADEDLAYVLWGIRDHDRAVVGTSFAPANQTIGRQPLDFWLAGRLSPSIAFTFKPVEHHGRRLVLLCIPAANTNPVEFERMAYVRRKLQPYIWESGLAGQFLAGDDVLSLLDYVEYFDLTQQPLPEHRQGIFERLVADQLIQSDVCGKWNITNLGAILFAKRFSDFNFNPSISRKAVRFTAYAGRSRADRVTHRQDQQKGYAHGLQELVGYIEGLLPRNEWIEKVVRKDQPLYPSIALRELIANALIHQDMTITGAGPLIELFSDRLEITNPGKPLVSPNRFLDGPPRSRNEALASLMRRMGLCEERGSGIDKVISAIEIYQLPPPDFREVEGSICVALFAPRSFADMTMEERLRACYQHATLKKEYGPGVPCYSGGTGSTIDPPGRSPPSPCGLCAVLGIGAKVLTRF